MTAKPLRIEMVLPSLPRAGMEAVTATLARGLVGRGHTVGFTCTEDTGELGSQLRQEGFRVSEVLSPGLRPNFIPVELAPWLRRLQPDVVHGHNGVWLKAVQAARSAEVPRVVLTLHGIEPVERWFIPFYNRLAARRADVVVAVSQSLRKYLVERVGVPSTKVCTIFNGLPIDHFIAGPRSPEVRRTLQIPHDALVIGTVARLHPVKNHLLLLDAFARVRASVPRSFLLLVGDGPLRSEIEQRIAHLRLNAHVCITGVVTDSAPYLREMDAFALPSQIEGLSISLLEAMACGVPVVATAVGGTPRLLEQGELGRLVPPEDAAALAAAIVELLTDPGRARQLAGAARSAVEASYSVPRMVAEYEAAYGVPTASVAASCAADLM
jgi:glycosyltransferase involved in cell wall biosynthesis